MHNHETMHPFITISFLPSKDSRRNKNDEIITIQQSSIISNQSKVASKLLADFWHID